MQWIDEDGINVLGTPLGSSDFIESYLFGKGIKHRQLLTFIQEVAEAGFPREAVAMLTGAAGPRLTHLLKSMEKNSSTEAWMKEMDSAHLSTWLHCLTSSPDLDYALETEEHHQLTDWLDLSPSYGGIELNSLARSADEKFVGSFAGIASSLIEFCRKTELPVYIGIAEALEALCDTVDMVEEDLPPSEELPYLSVAAIAAAAAMPTTSLSIPSDEELRTATQLVRGHAVVEVPGK